MSRRKSDDESILHIGSYKVHVDDGYDGYDEAVPEGCAACGGDYPNCKASCPLYDD